MNNKKMNISDLKINNNALPTNDLQRIKGGLGEPPPIGQVWEKGQKLIIKIRLQQKQSFL